MSKTATIKWLPFTLKQKQYVRDALICKMSVLEGAVRTGKTILNCIAAAAYLETCPDKIHLASGSSVANAKLNINDCNGFGLEHLFRGRCRKGQYQGNDALFIQTQTGEKIVIFVGGGKANSYKKILGNSYGLWIATEINEHYDCEDSQTSFIKVAFARQIAAIKPKVLWDLNPSSPMATIYTDYIDKYKKGYVGGYNYCHLSLEEVKHISKERKEEIKSQYIIGSVWYRRDILGERCIAEGLCHEYLASHVKEYLCSKQFFINRIAQINIGVDFGGNKSATGFVAEALLRGMKEVVVIRGKRIKKCLDPLELEREFINFCRAVIEEYGMSVKVRADSAESTLIKGIKLAAMKQLGGRCQVLPAIKGSIKGRISTTNKLVAMHKLWFYKDGEGVEEVITSLTRSTFDEKEERVDVVSFENPIDIVDPFEYAFEEYIRVLITINTLAA